MMAKEKEDDYKFGVEDLADILGIEPASARIKLRNANVKKAPTGRYGWKTKDELKALADKLKSAPAKAKADTKAKDAPKSKDKPAAKGKDAKPAAKGKSDDKGKKKAA